MKDFTFYFKIADTYEELLGAAQLRYQVYCLEKKWIKPKPFDEKKGLESDSLDSFSKHFICLNEDKKVIGTVRLITESSRDFPIKFHPNGPITEFQSVGKGAEVSRLIVDKEYRRTRACIGLFRIMYAYCRDNEISKLYMTLEPTLFRMLKSMKLVFAVESKPSFFFGAKTLTAKNLIQESEANMKKFNPELYDWFQEDPSIIEADKKEN